MHPSSHSVTEGSSHPEDTLEVAPNDVSGPTLPDKQGGFSLEKTMREILARLVLRSSIHLRSFTPLRLEDSGITPRTLGVYFKDLRVIGAGASAFFQNTVGSRFNPKVAYDDIHRALRPETRDILSGFSGVVRPREMLRKFHPHRFGSDGNLTPVQSSLVVLDRDALPSSRCLPTNGKRIAMCRVKFSTIPSLHTR